ncbi:MAG: DUF333 domain-containing protein [Anaerolineae bacterium]|nr:DUF333 domain-containing protein [Anaerolineae bacterium]
MKRLKGLSSKSYPLLLWLLTALLTASLFLAACQSRGMITSPTPSPSATRPVPAQKVGMANPASKYCEEHDGKLEIRKDAQGNEYSVCVSPDNSECEEWAFYRGECQPGKQQPESKAGTTEKSYDDPFAYCQAIGTIDAPDERYTGPTPPPAILKAIRKAAGIAKDAPDDWVAQGTVWRCMDGQVWGCFRGANIPCTAKVSLDKAPTGEMKTYCKEHANAQTIPESVTGHETAYEWRCNGETPEPVKQVRHPDKQGFISEFWFELHQ